MCQIGICPVGDANSHLPRLYCSSQGWFQARFLQTDFVPMSSAFYSAYVTHMCARAHTHTHSPPGPFGNVPEMRCTTAESLWFRTVSTFAKPQSHGFLASLCQLDLKEAFCSWSIWFIIILSLFLLVFSAKSSPSLSSVVATLKRIPWFNTFLFILYSLIIMTPKYYVWSIMSKCTMKDIFYTKKIF